MNFNEYHNGMGGVMFQLESLILEVLAEHFSFLSMFLSQIIFWVHEYKVNLTRAIGKCMENLWVK